MRFPQVNFLVLLNAILFALNSLSFGGDLAQQKVKVGADVLIEKRFDLIKGKRVGIVCNHTALLSDGGHLVDVLYGRPDVKVVALFGPEHGIRGDAPDGKSIEHGMDAKTHVPVYSLYGKTTKPTDEMLKGVDVLVFDIQDIGARFYTFISTLSLAMEAAAEHHIPYIVLDRPNPIRGTWVEGPIREDSLKSFVGLQPIPVVHGMTVGELATMFNQEHWLKNGVKANLTVVKMEGWRRGMWYDETGIQWVRPSPNMPTMKTAVVYPGACLIEGTNVSEGRGTERPFEYLGAPWIDGKKLSDELNSHKLPGVKFVAVQFTPVDIERVTVDPKFEGQNCGGILINVTDRNVYEPLRTGVCLVSALKKLYPNDFAFRTQRFDRLMGVSWVREMINAGKSPEEITKRWRQDEEEFKELREKYLLY